MSIDSSRRRRGISLSHNLSASNDANSTSAGGSHIKIVPTVFYQPCQPCHIINAAPQIVFQRNSRCASAPKPNIRFSYNPHSIYDQQRKNVYLNTRIDNLTHEIDFKRSLIGQRVNPIKDVYLPSEHKINENNVSNFGTCAILSRKNEMEKCPCELNSCISKEKQQNNYEKIEIKSQGVRYLPPKYEKISAQVPSIKISSPVKFNADSLYDSKYLNVPSTKAMNKDGSPQKQNSPKKQSKKANLQSKQNLEPVSTKRKSLRDPLKIKELQRKLLDIIRICDQKLQID